MIGRALMPMALLAATSLAPARDVAVIVGINAYPGINQLNACVPDAKLINETFRKQGFDVTHTLLDGDATRANIFAALDAAATEVNVGGKGRFVFYYAGHGRKDPPRLLPFDYPKTHQGITCDDLYERVSRIKARSNTVILDSCFSGGLARGDASPLRGRITDLRSRFYIDPDEAAQPELVARSSGHPPFHFADDAHFASGTAANVKVVCYATAAKANQEALEARFSNLEHHAFFTLCLLPYLQASSTPDWDTTIKNVAKDMDEILAQAVDKDHPRRYQDPSVTPEFRPLRIFDPFVSKPPFAVPATVMDQLKDHPDHSDASGLTLDLGTEKRGFLLGEPFQLGVTSKKEGYLVLLSRKSQTTLLWPKNRRAKDGYVTPGTSYPLKRDDKPGEASYARFDSPGDNEIIALRFDTEAGAQRLLDAIPVQASTLNNLDESRLKVLASPEDARYASAFESYAVGNLLYGGYEITDPKGFWNAIYHGTDLDRQLVNDELFGSGLNVDKMDEMADDATQAPDLRRELVKRLNTILGVKGRRWLVSGWRDRLEAGSPLRGLFDAASIEPEQGATLLAALFKPFIRPPVAKGST